MQFGLIEVRPSPTPVLMTSKVGHDFIRSDRALPERTEDREIHVSLVFEMVGQSVFRRRHVEIVPLTKPTDSDMVVRFPLGEAPETDDTMAQRVSQLMAPSLRPGEWLRGVHAMSSVIEQKFLELDLDDAKDGMLPQGASDNLVRALKATIRTGAPPQTARSEQIRSLPIQTTFAADQFVVGSAQHLERFEHIVANARSDVFVLSSFVAALADPRGKERKERIRQALEQAISRGVRCHLFYGTSLDKDRSNAAAMQELSKRLSTVTRGVALVHRDSVHTHAKILAADDGRGGAVVLLGSCNWLSSPFNAVEVSAELRENNAVAAGLDLLRSIVSNLATASRSIETLQFMSSDLRRGRSPLSQARDAPERPPAELTVLYADDHAWTLRKAAHNATQSFVCCTNTVGAPMVPALFNPAEVAGRRLENVRVYFSRYKDPTKRRHVRIHRDRLNGIVDLLEIREPRVHAKFLTWDKDNIVVSSLNWGSQPGSADNRLDEIGLYLKGSNLATALLEKFEAALKG